MRGPKPPVVELSPEEQQGLETLVRRYSTPQQLARRGRIILSAAAGLNNGQIAREVGLDVDTVRFWRNRWLGLQAAILEDLSIEERLRDAPRPGAPARITPEQVCQIMSLACEAPSQCGRPISQWTSRELADEIIEKGIVERISPRHAARLLVLQRRISKCDVWPFVFGHERAIAVGSWQYVVRFKLVTKTTLPDKLSL